MSESPIHPDLQRIARFLPRWSVGPRSLRVIRRLSGLRSPKETDKVRTVALDTTSVRWHTPPGDDGSPSPALLWIHGGGFVLGSAAQDDALCAHFARKLGIVVAAVGYRLAPEHPFPVPLEDCHDALVWLAQQDGVDPGRIAIGGASAGGGLAAGLALLARERGEVEPVFQLLTYPMLDDRTVLRSDIDERHFRLWNNKSNRFGWEAYTGHPAGADDVDPLAAPARHDDLAGLPPAWIGVGTLDLFHAEDLAYARRLEEAGVPCRLDVVDGAFHGFDVVPKVPVVKAFRATQVAALREALFG